MSRQKQPPVAKSLEQRVQELILKKLYIKVNDDELVSDKVDFILLVLRDVIALAKSDFDTEKALILVLEEQDVYRTNPDLKRNELKHSAVEFKMEAEAYSAYLSSLKDQKPDDLILSELLNAINSEPELLDRKLKDLVKDSLSDKITGEEASQMGIDKWDLIEKYCGYVMLIAESESIDSALDKLMMGMTAAPEFLLEKRESLKDGLKLIASFAGEEIDAVELAIEMRDKNSEYYKILERVKKELGL
jgi:hypothetical protein